MNLQVSKETLRFAVVQGRACIQALRSTLTKHVETFSTSLHRFVDMKWQHKLYEEKTKNIFLAKVFCGREMNGICALNKVLTKVLYMECN
jgi:hypothetical protein